jgi:hypothetical protein
LDQFKRVKEKLHQLKCADINFEFFGSNGRKYTFAPVLTENEIVAFENKHNITIPEEYRLFIKEIGNGGVGPFYGLLSLEDNEDQTVNLDFDFPFVSEAPLSLEKYREYDERIEIAFQTGNASEEESLWDLKNSLLDRDYQNATKGVTFLCHEGCGMFNVLILRGKEKGTVWWFNFSDEVGVMPILHNGKGVSFFDWYEIWLDDSMKYLKGEKAPFSTYGQFILLG